ncbi:checkpoint protein Hus1/Mec3 [Nitzschia inconspicua]|uniref:Checkpoint protein n=1 Tax=Nitzschia inconspicua TaxID=303405 RepID=A0A9K3K495_9STRA|nr:checkpoint protein Hus1/Mec3 [Nitzschia inconspicua]KAG7361938.1 checkpoint protein Hus1/Mec3 [Nitzschia inconspicua]
MRFKAKLTNDQLSVFHGVISPMSKLHDPMAAAATTTTASSSSFWLSSSPSSRVAVIYLDEEYLRISCKSFDMTCFAELSQKELFLEHRIESAADNVIVLQVDLQLLKVALQSVIQSSGHGGYYHNHQQQQKQQSSRSNNNNNRATSSSSAMQTLVLQQQVVILKLAKRNNLPCLCIEGRSAVTAENDVEIYQAIPVLIMRQSEMQHHLPPRINNPQVQLELPPTPIRAVIDKLKGMSKHIVLEGNMKGDLSIRIDQDGASLACFYNHLIPRWPQEEEEDENDIDDNGGRREEDGQNNTGNNPNQKKLSSSSTSSSCVIKVDSQKLSTCLQWQQQQQLPVTSCLLGMVYNEMLVLHILLAPAQVGFFTYYIPVHFLQQDDLIV